MDDFTGDGTAQVRGGFVDNALGWQIGQHRTEGDWHKQKRLKLVIDSQVKQHGNDTPHDEHAPVEVSKASVVEKLLEEINHRKPTLTGGLLQVNKGLPLFDAIAGFH